MKASSEYSVRFVKGVAGATLSKRQGAHTGTPWVSGFASFANTITTIIIPAISYFATYISKILKISE
jgi:hypothetical protein